MKSYYMCCAKCRSRIFKFRGMPYTGMKLTQETVELTKLQKGELFKCGHCGEIVRSSELNGKNLEVIDESDSK